MSTVLRTLCLLSSHGRDAATVHALCHHVDFDSKHPALLFGRRPLQAEVPAGKLHGELHFDLERSKLIQLDFKKPPQDEKNRRLLIDSSVQFNFSLIDPC